MAFGRLGSMGAGFGHLGAGAGGGASLSAEAASFFARLATQPSAARKTQYDTLIKALVAAGVWTKLDVLYVFAAVDQATALTNLVQATYGGTAAGSPTFTVDQGFTGASTKYIDSGFNPTTAVSPKYVQDNASIFAWGNLVTASSGPLAGVVSGTSIQLYGRNTDDKNYYLINSGTLGPVNSDGSGFWTGVRTASNAIQSYRNGVSVATATTASVTVVNSTITFMRNNATYYPALEYCGGFGQSLSSGNALALYNALHTYMQAVAGLP
jgi:hypothetical protein